MFYELWQILLLNCLATDFVWISNGKFSLLSPCFLVMHCKWVLVMLWINGEVKLLALVSRFAGDDKIAVVLSMDNAISIAVEHCMVMSQLSCNLFYEVSSIWFPTIKYGALTCVVSLEKGSSMEMFVDLWYVNGVWLMNKLQ